MKKKRTTSTTATAKKKTKKAPAEPEIDAPTHDVHGDPIDIRVRKLIALNKTLPEQRSPGWYEQRETRMTASPVASVLRLTQFEIDLRDNEDVDFPMDKKVGHVMPAFSSYNDLMRTKCGVGAPFTGSVATEWGVAYEPVITELYEVINGTQVHEFGMIPHPDLDWLGASPDGITTHGRMLEIKCPHRRIPKCNSRGEAVPKIQYWVQMQIQMECCGFDECDFVDVQLEEFGSRGDYLEDCYGTVEDGTFVYGRTAKGQPKGFIIQKTTFDEEDNEKYEYFYPPVLKFTCQDEEDAWLEKWAASTMDVSPAEVVQRLHGYVKYEIRYWRVEQYLLKTVQRNKEWLAERLPEVHEFWKKVLLYREEGIPEDLSRPPSDVSFLRSSSSAASSNQLFIDPSTMRLTNETCQFYDDEDNVESPSDSSPPRPPLRAATLPVIRSTHTVATKRSTTQSSQECLFYDSDQD